MTSTLRKAPSTGARDTALASLNYVAGVMEAEGQPRLTEEQWGYALRVLEAALYPEGAEPSALVLEGPAGTGKTTVLTWIILALAHLERPAGICAYTHKACSVLRQKLAPWSDRFAFSSPTTVHSLLNLRMRRGKPGGPLEFYQYATPDLESCSLVIVDECSMIGKDLYEVIISSCSGGRTPVLFAGDPCQLQPVNESAKSRTFAVQERLELTHVLRHDGAILDLATKIRTLRFVPPIRPAKGAASQVRVHFDAGVMTEDWLLALKVHPPEDVVMLTYTNAARREFNDKARKALYGPDVARFTQGDVVIALEPVISGDRILYQNNQDIEITDVQFFEAFEPLDDLGVTFAVWELTTAQGVRLFVLDDSELEHYKKTLDRIKRKIMADVKDAEKRLAVARAEGRSVRDLELEVSAARAAWTKYFYPLQEFFAQVDYKYSMTIHKSQGSEWPVVYVNDDYMKSREEYVQLLYVAITRASRVLNHVDNNPKRT